MSKYGVISGPNAGKYRPKLTPYLNTFHAASCGSEVQNVSMTQKTSASKTSSVSTVNFAVVKIATNE